MKLRGLILVCIVALAAALRWHQIGVGSLWIDEGNSITLARLPWKPFFETLCRYEANQGIYYGLLRAWMRLGDSEAVVRSLSALFGTAAVAGLYWLGRRLFGARVGLLASALLAVNVFHVWFSQEVRSYALVVFLTVLSLLLFVEAVEHPRRWGAWAGYAVASVLAVYAHFFAALVLAAQWLAAGPRRLRGVGVRRLALVVLALVVPLLPLAAFILRRDQGQIDWVPPTTAAHALATVLALSGFNPLMLILLVIGLVWSLRDLTRDDEDGWRIRLVGLCFAFPITAIALASVAKHLFFFRYFAICLPAGALLAARVLTPVRILSRPKRVTVDALAALTLGLGLLVTGGSYGRLHDWGGDWRSATEYVLANRRPGDGIIFYVSAGLDAYRYYRDRVPSSGCASPLPVVVFPEATELASAHLVPDSARLQEASARHPRLWLVLHQKDASALPAPFLATLRLVEERKFTAVGPEMRLTVALYRTGLRP
jgi:hypothetical protein